MEGGSWHWRLEPRLRSLLLESEWRRLRVSLPASLRAAASSIKAGEPDQCLVNMGEDLLTINALPDLSFATVDKKLLYYIWTKFLFFKQLARHQVAGTRTGSTRCISHMAVALQASHLQKSGDLQWRGFHSAIPVNCCVSRFNPDVMLTCLFHVFFFFFFLLNVAVWYLFYRHCWSNLGLCLISISLFLQWDTVRRERKNAHWQTSFLVRQSWPSTKPTRQREKSSGNNLVGVFKVTVRTRVPADISYCKMTWDLVFQPWRLCRGGGGGGV